MGATFQLNVDRSDEVGYQTVNIMTKTEMKSRLSAQFPDADVAVMDLTGTEDHWEVRVASKAFAGQSRINCQRLVMDVFAAELKTGEVHALTIKTSVKE